MSANKMFWFAIKNRHFVPKIIVDSIEINKPHKSNNILISSLRTNVYFSISHCKMAKTMWDSLQVLNKGTEDMNQYKINMLT